MKKSLLFMIACAFAVSSCTFVNPGYKALKVYALGDKKGEMEIVGIGRHPINIFGYYSYIHYPTNAQRELWEGPSQEEGFMKFQAEGLLLSVNVGLTYKFDEAKLIQMYSFFRRTPEEIVSDFIKIDIQDNLQLITGKMMVEEVYSSKKSEVIEELTKRIQSIYEPKGILIERIMFTSDVKLPKNVIDAINLKIKAKQEAEQMQNEIERQVAVANKSIEDARGTAESLKINAQGRADAMDIEGRALARNPNIIRLKELEVQEKFAGTLKNVQTLVIPNDRSSMMLNLGK